MTERDQIVCWLRKSEFTTSVEISLKRNIGTFWCFITGRIIDHDIPISFESLADLIERTDYQQGKRNEAKP